MACSRIGGVLSTSAGWPYEVLVLGDTMGIVRASLEVDAEGLSQPEPEFDVSTASRGELSPALRKVRSIVILEVDSAAYRDTRMWYEKNKYARPQIVVHIGTPSVSVLRHGDLRWGRQLRMLLSGAEIHAAITQLERHRNIEAEKLVERELGVRMWIPEDLTAVKKGKDFVWLSNNAPSNMCNIVIYKGAGCEDATAFAACRDSALASHIKGETDDMVISTVRGSVGGHKKKIRNREICIHRGLWEMRGDGMGGPFVSHTVGSVTAEAFLFAPGKKKRNRLRQLEAALYTINP